MGRVTDRATKRKRLVLVLLAELLLLAVVTAFIVYRYVEPKKADTPVQSGVSDEKTEDSDVPLATLLFASDYQYEDGFDEPSETLNSIINSAERDGKSINAVIMCGDYSNENGLYDYQVSPEPYISEIRKIVAQKTSETVADNIIFVQGNHDSLTDSISDSGLREYDNYLVYVLNTQNDFPWCQGETAGSLDKVKKASADMKQCFDKLIEDGETRPIIIAGHVPLHFTARTSSHHTTGDNLYASQVFDVVNEAGKTLNIVYLFGHDHSKGWDCYLGGAAVYKPAGDAILVPIYDDSEVTTDDYSEEKLNFTYLNAGYTGYYINCSEDDYKGDDKDKFDAADMTLTGTVCEVYPDRLVLTRYDSEGAHVIGAEGAADPYKNGVDNGLITEEHYSKVRNSPQVVNLKI